MKLNDVAQYMVPPRFLVGVPVPLGMEQRLWHKAMQAAAAAAMAAIWQPGVLPRGFSCAGTEAAITALKELAEKAGAPQAKTYKGRTGKVYFFRMDLTGSGEMFDPDWKRTLEGDHFGAGFG